MVAALPLRGDRHPPEPPHISLGSGHDAIELVNLPANERADGIFCQRDGHEAPEGLRSASGICGS
jgi:hypothetical protein